jgi:hypothetical protein
MQQAIVNPGDRKKMIWAIVLGFIALVFLWWTFIGFGGNSKPISTRAVAVSTPSPAPRASTNQGPAQQAEDLRGDMLNQLQPISLPTSSQLSPEPKRNIFSYYEPPPPPAKEAVTPTPTPTPTPPVLLAAVSPATVYARTGDFTLEVTGDKFTPDVRVVMDGRELATRYTGPQQASANVPASMIASPGARQVMLRSPDGKLYSNPTMVTVTPPPLPNYTYVGIIGTRRHLDTAIVQDKGSKEILNVQRGDVLGGRFRITSISDSELVLMDTNLKIKHTLPFTTDNEKGFNPLQRPTPKVDSEDDEP